MASTLKVDTIVHPSGTPDNLTLDNAGNVTIGNNLTVTGTTTQTGSTTFTTQTLFPDGTAGAPAISNTGDTNCGIYFPAADTVSVATSGTQAIQVNSSQQLEISDGTVSLPSLTNIGDTNTGVYFPAADNVALATNGTAALTVDSNQNVSITGVIDGLSTPGVATGTGSSSGGTLAAATYYVRIVAFDSAGNTTNAGTESTGVTTTGSTSSIAYTWTAVTGATGYRVYFSTTSGTYASGYFVTTSASYTLTTTSGSFAVGLPSSNTTGISLMSNQSFKRNRIINGDMRVDQRNAGASGTGNGYTVDRFAYFGAAASKGTWQQNAGSVTPPAGFTNYLGFTSSSAYTVGASEQFNLYQPIEGLNISDLGWGTANARTVTLSFWVRSSLTGTFGGSIYNSAVNRSYPYSYTISSANTWEQKSVTIAGDTSGTWLTTNGVGLYLNFGLGAGSTVSNTAGSWYAGRFDSATGATSVVGTNGATFYITGVQLEVGSVATPYERQIYSEQLAQCQRYFQFGGNSFYGTALSASTTNIEGAQGLFPTMRSAPTMALTSGVNVQIRQASGAADFTASSPTLLNVSSTVYGVWTQITGFTGLTAAAPAYSRNNGTSNFLSFSAEL